MMKIKFSKRVIVAFIGALLSFLGCATKVYVDGIKVEITEDLEYVETLAENA